MIYKSKNNECIKKLIHNIISKVNIIEDKEVSNM